MSRMRTVELLILVRVAVLGRVVVPTAWDAKSNISGASLIALEARMGTDASADFSCALSLCKRRMQTTHVDHALTACSLARSIWRKRYHMSLRSFRSMARLLLRRGNDAPLSNFTNMLP